MNDQSPNITKTTTQDPDISRRRLGSIALSSDELNESTNQESGPTSLGDRAVSFIRRYGPGHSLFARDSSLRFMPSKSARTFSFNPESFEVKVPLSWFVNEKYTEDELDFANHHEIAHFIDMRKNPEAYIEQFEQNRKDAEVLAKEYLRSHPNKAPREAIFNLFYSELRSLYNVLDDIYVNNLVFCRNRRFRQGNGKASVESLYKKLGFEKADLTDQPLHRQMTYSLLRDEMIGESCGKSVVDGRVETALSKIKLGKSIRGWINFDLKPRGGVLADPAERYKIIRRIIQPEYIELLKISLDENDKPQNSPEDEQDQKNNQQDQSGNNEQSGRDNNSSGESDEREDTGFDPFGDKKNSKKPQDILDHGEDGEKVIKEILDSLKESKRVSKMSAEERTKYQNKKRTEKFDKDHGISETERETIELIKSQIVSARKEMYKFWRNLIGKSIEYQQTVIPYQKRGRLSIRSYIEEYPELIDSERRGDFRSLEVYERRGLERKIVDQPEVIDISLLVDCSGSMDFGQKVETAKKAAALLMYSIKDFNDELNRTRSKTHSKLRANSEIITFGSYFKTRKYFERSHSADVNETQIIKSVSKINSDLGSTDDALPLKDIQSRLTTEEKKRIKNGKLKKIIFVITDGASDNQDATATILKELSEDGVLVIGFQIGQVSDNERSIFESIWNGDDAAKNPNKRGVYIGEDISKLPQRLMSALSDALRGIMI